VGKARLLSGPFLLLRYIDQHENATQQSFNRGDGSDRGIGGNGAA
jgi:hypothetical protein